jgi:cytochrome b
MSLPNRNPSTVKAWDPLVRVFHWSLVFFFLLAFSPALGPDRHA